MTRILVDVDGVICDFVGSYLGLIKKVTGVQYKHSDVTDWSFQKCLGLSDAVMVEVDRLLFEPGFVRSLSSINGSYEGIYGLKNRGYEVVFVTSPWKGHPTWAYEREQWLNERFQGFPIISTHTKQYVFGDTLVDDKPSHLTAWVKEHHMPTFLWDAPYNQDHPLSLMITRINSWNNIERFI